MNFPPGFTDCYQSELNNFLEILHLSKFTQPIVFLEHFHDFRYNFKRAKSKKLSGLSCHRYSVIFSADSEFFLAFLAMFRAVLAGFNFDISGHS